MKINETIRKDGLRVISCQTPHTKQLQVELIARVGYAHDPAGKEGFFHTFEHMAFKGTQKRSLKELQSFARKNLVGANAVTGALATAYQALTIDRNLPEACEYLCDIYLNSTFPAAELKKEKKTILLEAARRKDSDAAIALETLYRTLYKKNPLRLSGVGNPASIQGIKRRELLRQKVLRHVPSNTIILALGSVAHHDFVREINKHFPLKFKKSEFAVWSDESSELPLKQKVILTRPKRQKALLLLGCKIPHLDMADKEAVSLFNKIIGGLQNSILFHEIREKRGLAYIIESAFSGTAGLGNMFHVYAEIKPAKINEVEKLIWRILSRPISDQQLFKERRNLIFNAFEVASVEQNRYLGSYGGSIYEAIVEGRPVKSLETMDQKRLKILAKLSLKDLERVRKQFIRPERFVKVILKSE